MTRREVAKRMGLTYAQVRRAEKEGLRKLRAALEARGIDAETVIAAFRDRLDTPTPKVTEQIGDDSEEATEEDTTDSEDS